MAFTLELNERERTRITKQAQSCIDTLNNIIEAVEKQDDTGLGALIVLFTLQGSGTSKEWGDMLVGSISNKSVEFPDIINETTI